MLSLWIVKERVVDIEMKEQSPDILTPDYFEIALEEAKVEIDFLEPYNIGIAEKPMPGQLVEVPWPETDVRDYRLGLEDGRTLAVQTAGLPNDYPVILLHGMPGGRIGVRRIEELLDPAIGMQLITYDRPGYGGSDRQAERSVADCVQDVAAIAKAFGLTKYSVVGRSGGAPHALACAANLGQLPGEVDEIISLVSPAPPHAPDEVRFGNLGTINTDAHARDIGEKIAHNYAMAAAIRSNPLHMMVSELISDLRLADHQFIAQLPDLVRLAISHYFALTNENGEQCIDGWLDDERALSGCQDWGFDLAKVAGEKVTMWAGTDDAFCPSIHTEWLAAQINPKALHLGPHGSHFTAMDTTVVLDTFLASRARQFNEIHSRG